MKTASRLSFFVASAILIVLAYMLIAFGVTDMIHSLGNHVAEGKNFILRTVSYVVVAVAILDVAKYFLEEEVFQNREKQSLEEARASLTKFITTVIIAVFVEGLVAMFEAGDKGGNSILYAAVILGVATIIVLSLGLYQRMSVSAERDKVHQGFEEKDRPVTGSTPDENSR
ncbi:hypothetical protein GOB87_10925 [Acetobacter estunensis]|uniref:GNAT family acetyltransferase n=1 Tax=Acetobacter estunensis TaxID=104097 RepID=A0A967ECC3_9PROT|nr:hypothetical protein [Acetobacter estunensis]NHO54458.1 hypothetical protein [Acetobacter estunensis]